MILEINQKFGTNYIVSVNCSAIELTAKDYFEFIINTMNNMNVPPNWIEIEITEKVSIDIDTQNYSVLTQLQETGISLAIDDFGTGYSSLSSLVNLPVSTLKLDRVFIGDVSENINKQKIIKSVVEMSKVLNYEVIAEGVETLEQLEILKNTLCEFFQGYYFSKPILFEELIKYLENKKIIDNGEII